MIPYDMDPSLYTSDPEPPVLDDGFSPPHREATNTAESQPGSAEADPELGVKSLF
jgi:hypothetical protein